MQKTLFQFKRLRGKKRLEFFNQLELNKKAFLLLEISKKEREKLLKAMPDEEIVEVIDYLDPEEATKVLRAIEEKRRKKILSKLGEEIREKIELLLSFDPRTAASIVSLDYIEVEEDKKIKDALNEAKNYEKKYGKFPTILIVKEGILKGELPGYYLGTAKKNEKVSKYVRKVPTLGYKENRKKIVETFKKHPHDKVIILDEDGSIIGIVHSKDLLKEIEKESLKTLQDFAGVRKEEDVFDPPLTKVKNRYYWLMINLLTEFFAASIISLFQGTLSAYVLLAVYMPIVAGMGGNAGTQTMAVVVRGLALKKIEKGFAKRVIINEIIAGAINGMINGAIVALVAITINHSPLIGVAVFLSMIINLIVAAFFGATIPFALKKMGKDPASSSTIFITTATDAFGFFSFLGIATLLMG